MPIKNNQFVEALYSIPEEDRQAYVNMTRSGVTTVPFSGGTLLRSPEELGFRTNPNPQQPRGGGLMGMAGIGIGGLTSRNKKNETTAESKRLNIAPAMANRIASPVTSVETKSPAYAKGGMVRGCGKATKGRGKVRMY